MSLSHSPLTPQAQDAGCAVMAAAWRVLHRTAMSLASTPGGLRFKPNSRPWLDGLPADQARPAPALSSCQLLDRPA